MQRSRSTIVFALLVGLVALSGFTAVAGGSGTIPLILNDSFTEIVFTWKLQNGSSDAPKCAPKVPPGTSGDCAFKFKGSPNEAAKLSQKSSPSTLSDVNALLSSSGGLVNLSYDYYSTSEATKIDAKIVVVWTPDGGIETKSKMVDPASGSTLSGIDYIWATEGPISTITVDQDATVSKIKVQFKNSSTSGKAYIDNILATMTGPSS
ncbi:MAG: hypothetical protein IPM16_13955 [Chloroflexi bacterium]|nr:hypothetical protein [Chloroflexota bacterium]